ncbi:cation:proton antiporter [Nitratifractor salsuginis]|uniref:Sodium/hydrogen exchanger n=1 Tax=Nitratifractor salsuginis (strain DSM 16511 / JCM 12458 / E9I37-1) TaxID=749222 RepID=E6X1U3_NITSE|nr:cation:proton antiporter [Nitratifractor salsuginis]ADV45951.1 sodium/hydrogen exchanger [Nitratifractor salsuginis DSM 16511]
MHHFAPEIVLITILSLVVLADALALRLRIPSVFLLLLGSYLVYHYFPAAIPIDLKEHFDSVILFCIPLIFMGDALHLKFADLKRHGWGIFYLAVVAVALSIIAGASLYAFDLFPQITLGGYVALFAINMATDAVSVQSVLSRFKGVAHDVKVLIEGESLGNDATAVIAFFFIGLPWMMQGSIEADDAALEALRVFAFSTLIGLGLGYGFYWLMKFYSDKRGELFTFVIEAYAAYLLGEHFHLSGILTLIVAIVSTKAWIDRDIEIEERQLERKRRSFVQRLRLEGVLATTRERLEYIYEMASEFGYIAAVVIFFVLAEMVDLHKLWEYRREILAMFVATTLIRALSMAKFAWFGQKLSAIKPVGAEGWFILTFSGMKGALSIILVHMIPADYPHRELFESVTVGVVILSIFVYGTVLWAWFTFRPEKERRLFGEK